MPKSNLIKLSFLLKSQASETEGSSMIVGHNFENKLPFMFDSVGTFNSQSFPPVLQIKKIHKKAQKV